VNINVSLSFTEGNVGEELEITGKGFWDNENIQIFFDDVDITADYVDGSPQVGSGASNEGEFTITVPIPASSNGSKTIKIKGSGSHIEVTKQFEVLSKLILEPSKGESGDQIIVTGTGFARSNYVDIFFDNTLLLRTAQRASNGSFMQAITIPADKDLGSYQIRAVDTNNSSINASAVFDLVAPPLSPEITLNPQGETAGSTIDISGVEFNNNKNITLSIDGVTVTPDAAIKSTSTGSFSGSFTIPELPAGTHTVEASDGTTVGVASAIFTVTHKAEIDKTSGKAGDTVTVTGTGFKAGTAVVINFGGDTNVAPTGAKTDANGSFSTSFTVPAVAEGTHNVKISVGSDSVTKTFTTSIVMTMSPESGKSGTEVVVTVEGLEPDAIASIYFGSTKLSSATISDHGKLNFIFNVPVAAEGTHSVKVEVDGITVSRDFTISADATFTPTSGKVGDDISITGSGFGSAKSLTLTWDGKAVEGSSGLVTTAEGNFNITFKVPAVKGGSYTISISDGTITKTQTFTVTASAPPIPQPVSPALASKVKGNVTFEWNPVTYDIMGFTYQLQVSKDSTFANVLINKTGLTAAKYSLTDAEKLDKTGSGESYYWRVRAVDEAGNEGAWTSNANFTVGGGWPSWLTWVLIGLGVVVLGILAFWVGRRIAYYSY
ncbi:MAG: IPT/TIG domain-containing protein, partial [Fastidiosipilaceae bacterium]